MDFILGIAMSLIAAIIMGLAQIAHRRTREVSAPYSGVWEDEIFDAAGDAIKRDRFEFRQYGEVLSGDITRIYPGNQNHRQYGFTGRIRDGVFFAVFWSLDPSIPSNGSWYLRQVREPLTN